MTGQIKKPGMSAKYVTIPKNTEEFHYLGTLYEKRMLINKEIISKLKEKLEYHKAKAEKWERKYNKLNSYIVDGDIAINWVVKNDDSVLVYFIKKRDKLEQFSSRKEAELWILKTFGVEICL